MENNHSSQLNHSGTFLLSKGPLQVFYCTVCGFAHLFPLADNRSYYRRQFLAVDKPNYLTDLEDSKAWWKIRFELELGFLDALFPNHGDLLDVGCGFGHFLEAARAGSWQVHGVEPADWACQVLSSKGLDFQQGLFEDVGILEESLEVVRMAWVLEHVQEPLAALQLAWKLLKPGGCLILIAPNDFSRLQKIANSVVKKKYYWVNKAHLNYFNSITLTGLANRAGFSFLGGTAFFPMEFFLLLGVDYTRISWLGTLAHKIRVGLEKQIWKTDPALLTIFGTAMFQIGLGRDLLCFYQKPQR